MLNTINKKNILPFPDIESLTAQTYSALKSINDKINIEKENRLLSIEKLKKINFPDRKNEAWKYSNIKKYIKNISSINNKCNYNKNNVHLPCFSDSHYNIVIKDCIEFEKKFDSEKITFANSKNIPQKISTYFKKFYNKIADNTNEWFLHYNTAFHQNTFLLYIEENVKINNPVNIYIVLSNNNVIYIPRFLIVASQNSYANINIHYISANEKLNSLIIDVIEAIVNENSNLTVNRIQTDNNGLKIISYLESKQYANSYFLSNNITVKADFVRNNTNIYLKGKNSSSYVNALTLLNKQEHCDNRIVIHHFEENCRSQQLVRNVLSENSTAVFNGKFFVHKNAQKTDAFQSSASILLSENSKVYTKPELEIYTDDVKCSHGSTVGQIDKEAMFYLNSRGISKEKAEKILISAFFINVINNIADNKLKNHLSQSINHKIALLNENNKTKT